MFCFCHFETLIHFFKIISDVMPVTESKYEEKKVKNTIQNATTKIINKYKSQKSVKKIGKLKHNEKHLLETEQKKDNTNLKYYQTAFISNPCDQFFGPKHIDFNNDSYLNISEQKDYENTSKIQEAISEEKFEYIPTPSWSKAQNIFLEEMFRKGRFPKTSEIKSIAQELNVMKNDIEEWFRKRRGHDRKTRHKNNNLKCLIDNYLQH